MNNDTQTRKLVGKKFLPGVAWFFILLVLICLPGKSLPKTHWLDGINFDKLVHCVLFGTLAVLFCLPFKKTSFSREEKVIWFVKIVIATSVWGLTTELIQKYFIVGRNFDLLDWLADSIGAVLALGFCRKYFL